MSSRLTIAWVFWLALIATSCTRSPDDSSDSIRVRFGIDSGGFSAQVWVAEELEYFDDVGIDAQLNVYSIGADTIVGLLAGKEDFGVATAFPILAAEQDDHMKVVATIARPEPGFYQFAATSNIRDVESLPGKRVGVHQGTNQEYVTIRFLENSGIDPSSVEFARFAGQFEIVAAMRSGDVDAAWVWGIGVDQARAIEGVEILVGDGVAGIDHAGFLAGSARFLNDQPEALGRITKALKRAADFIESNEDNMRHAADIIASKQKAPLDTVLTILSLENYTVGFTGEDRDGLQQLAAWQVGAGIRSSSNIERLLETSAAESID